MPASARRRLVAVAARGGLEELQRPGDVLDAAVTQFEKVRHGELGAFELVDRDAGAGSELGGLEGHDRQRQLELAHRVEHADVRRDHDERLDALVEQEAQAGEHRRAIGRRRRDERVIADEPGRPLERLDGARRAVVAARGSQHADRMRAAGRQNAGGGVAPVAELADRGDDPLAGLGPDVLEPVEHPADGLMRDARDIRDVLHVRRTTRHGIRHPRRPSRLLAHYAGRGERLRTPERPGRIDRGAPGGGFDMRPSATGAPQPKGA